MSGNVSGIPAALKKQVLGKDTAAGEFEESKASSREIIRERITFLTRALVKNNFINQNSYIFLITLEYISMMYYVLRIVDYTTLYKGFSFVENFLNIEKDAKSDVIWDTAKSYQSGSQAIPTGETSQNYTITDYDYMVVSMEKRAQIHVLVNCVLCGIYTAFLILFFLRASKITNFDQTQNQSYSLKALATFMVLSKTVLKIPILVSIMIVAKALSLGQVSDSMFYFSLICNTLLASELTLVVLYALKFFNLEVPNDDIAWSHNQTSGFYFKLILNIVMVSQELYRGPLENIAVQIIVLAFIMALESLILMYRMNSPNIFNTIVHDYTLFLESLVISLTIIGMIAIITQRDILSTMAYLCIFIPVIIKIFYSVDQNRKHLVLFKLKNEEQLTSNEYLIAITHLLKMIKRQSETDMAQLLSFTYYHKLYCYDTGCICQFFTQYCQDPMKFKSKKRRTYRGYKDDGMKLIQQHDSEGGLESLGWSHQALGQDREDAHNSIQGTNLLQNRSANVTASSQGRPQDFMMMGVETSAPPNAGPPPSLLGFGNIMPAVSNSPLINSGLPLSTNQTGIEIYDSTDGQVPNTSVMNQADAQSALDQYNPQFVNLNGATSALSRQDQQNQDSADASIQQSGMNNGQNINEFKESGISGLFVRNQVLRGSAFNGFDSNMDFKIKGEFKSPSQFKSTHESRTYFFTRLLETMLKQLEQRTKKNVSFTLISIYFNFVYQHNIYVAAINLVKISKALNQSALQKLTFSVSEYYLLEMIMNDFKHHTKDEIDYNSFINSSQMQQRLDWLFEDASQDIIQFWRLFKEEHANVQKAYHLAMVISKNISLIRDYTTQLEERQLIKDYNKYYYYAMFYQNLLNDRQSYNQIINNLRNLLMIKNMQRKNSRFGGTLQDINDIGFAIFAIEDGGVQDKSVGKFIYCNKTACTILNVSEEEVLGKAAAIIMPDLIRQSHDLFVKRFFNDGLNRLMGKVRNVYVRDFTGYVKPVQFFINFYYNSKFNYSIIMHIDPIHTLTYCGSSSQISIKHCMIFLCSEDNVVQNMTENVRRVLGLTHKRVSEEEEILGHPMKIDDLVVNFSRIEMTIKNNKLNFLPNQPVKLRNFRGQAMANQDINQLGSDLSTIQCSLTFEEVVYMKNYPGQFTEKIYLLIPNTKIPELIESGSGNPPGAININNWIQSNKIEQPIDSRSGLSHSTVEVGEQLTHSCSSISSSRINSSTGITNTQNLLFQQKSPKILNLYLSIVFGVFVSFMIITSINFTIYIQKKNNVNLQIQFNQIINQRNIYLTSTILDLKMLQLISQPKLLLKGSFNTSNIFPSPADQNRFGKYGQMLTDHQDILQTNHQAFKMMSQRYSELTANQDMFKLSRISYQVVSDNGTPYLINNTLDFGIQLLISNAAMIKPPFFLKETIPMELDDYLKNLVGSNRTVTQLFKNLLYIYRNGMTHINNLIRLENDYILDNTISTSSNSTLFINLTSFISIGMITLIGIFTFPMLGKIEDRKISVLKFFNLLNVDQIQNLIRKGEEFREEFSSLQRNVNQTKQENTLEDASDTDEDANEEYGVSTVKRQVIEKIGTNSPNLTNKQSSQSLQLDWTEEDTKLENVMPGATQSREMDGSKQMLSLNQQDKMKRKINTKNGAGIRNIFRLIKKNEENMKNTYNRLKSSKAVSQLTFSSNSLEAVFNSSQKGGGGGPIDKEEKAKQKAEKYKAKEEIKEEEDPKSRKDSGKKHKKSKNGKREKNKPNQGNDLKEEPIQEDDQESDEDDSNEEQGPDGKKNKDKKDSSPIDHHLDSKRGGSNSMKAFGKSTSRTDHINEKLEKVALKEKVKLAFYVLFVLIFLNSCLIACFSIGQKTFKEDSKAVFSLTTFHNRQNCLDNLLLYTMEQLIRNRTIEISPDEPDAVQYYIEYCQLRERDFNDLRKNLPVFLEDARPKIDNLESSNLCKTIYKASEVATIASCESVYDEIMKRGFTQTLYTIFNYAQSISVRFQKQERTLDFLNRFIYEDQKLRDLIDLVKSYIHDAFHFIQTKVTDNSIAYFNKLGYYYMIIYSCYMVVSILMCLIFGLFMFKKLRDQIITSANILMIMPLEELDSRDRQTIEIFLNS